MILRYYFKVLELDYNKHDFRFIKGIKAYHFKGSFWVDREYVCDKCGTTVVISIFVRNNKADIDTSDQLWVNPNDCGGTFINYNEDHKLLTCNQVIMKKACE